MVALKRMRSHSKLYSGSSIEKTYSAQNEFVRAIFTTKDSNRDSIQQKITFWEKIIKKVSLVRFERESGGDSDHTVQLTIFAWNSIILEYTVYFWSLQSMTRGSIRHMQAVIPFFVLDCFAPYHMHQTPISMVYIIKHIT